MPRRNPPKIVNVGIGALTLGLMGFVAYKFFHKPKPVWNAQGIVTKAGWTPGAIIRDPSKVYDMSLPKTQWIYHAVGERIQ